MEGGVGSCSCVLLCVYMCVCMCVRGTVLSHVPSHSANRVADCYIHGRRHDSDR